MKNIISYTIAILLLNACIGSKTKTSDLVLKYDGPAKTWTEALPIGNGRQGAMIYGNALNEKIQLNENTLYSGEPSTTYKGTNIRPSYNKVLKLIQNEDYEAAENIMSEKWLGRLHQYYQPFGDLMLNFSGAKVSEYSRTLDLENAISTVSYRADGVHYKRETLASFPDQVIAIKISADKKAAISFDALMESVHPNCKTLISGNTLTFSGQVPGFIYRRSIENAELKGDQHKYPELFHKDGSRKACAKQIMYGEDVNGKGMSFEGKLQVQNKGGKLSKSGKSISISNADEVVLLLSMATSFNGFDKSPSTEGKDPASINTHILNKLNGISFEELKDRHIVDYTNLFNRVNFCLHGTVNNKHKPTDERLKEYATNQDPAFNALLFQYGRYLMIAGSREGGQPLNLQGIWNNKIMPPWNSAYTMNINLEMNYWPAEVTNLSECHQPLFQFIKELAVTGKETATNMYGRPGWVAHHNTDIWRPSYPADNDVSYSYWPMVGGWLTSHMWEHYLFTGDVEFLKNEAYPLMKGCAEFFASWLIKNKDGYLLTPMSTSPEHGFVYADGKISSVSMGSTMDMAIIKENFERTIEASKILGIDADFAAILQDKYKQLLPYQIGKRGQLQEWSHDYEEHNKQHRHLSHLYALHPSNQISKTKTPELFEAAAKTLALRGDEATGWSMGWKINFWARMLDGNHAYKIINNLFRFVDEREEHKHGGLYANLFDAHPPFQIDGNFGYTAGVAEMLLQSHTDVIHLLPALPDAWPNGSISGLKARGNIEVCIDWKNGELQTCSLLSQTDQAIIINLKGNVIEQKLKNGQTVTISAKHF